MTKPHEMKLRHTDSGVHGGYLVEVETGLDVASLSKEFEHLRPLLAAAPDMARALLGLGHFGDNGLGAWHTEACWENRRVRCEGSCNIVRLALTKAGELP